MEARQALMCTHGYPREIMELLKGLYHHPFMLKVNFAKIITLLWGSTVYLIPSIPMLTFLNCAFVELEGAFIFFSNFLFAISFNFGRWMAPESDRLLA